MGVDQLESHLAGLFSDFVAPEPDPGLALGGPLSALEPQAGLGAKGGSRRVVILHSHLESARLLSGFFKKHGDRVWQAADLAEARSLLERNGPGLLVTDWGTPHDGWLAELGKLRGRFAGTKVLATEGYPAPQPSLPDTLQNEAIYQTRSSRSEHPEPVEGRSLRILRQAQDASAGLGEKVSGSEPQPKDQARARIAGAWPRGSLSGVRVAPAAGVAAGAAELRSYPSLAARLPGRLNELVLAIGYPLVIGLIEAVSLWVDPRWGFALYSLVLLALLSYATFGKDAKLGHLCLALTIIPTIQILGLSTAWGEFRFVQHFLILSGLLLLMTYLALNYLLTNVGPTSLGPEQGFWGVPVYMLVPLVAMPAILVTYQTLKFVLLGSAPITVNAIAPLLLIGLLVLKELTSTAEGRWGTLGQVLNIAIGPLFLVFCINVALRIADVLR